MTRVSVIVPVYNVENYIEEMLKSVQRQTFQDFEVIIVNDGSTDGSQNIIDKFCNADERFKSVIKENDGVASARNLGIEVAAGDYVVFYDPDDFIPEHALEKMYKKAIYADADIVVGVMEEESLGERKIYMHSQKLAKQNHISQLDEHFFGAWSLCHKMFSLSFIKKNGLKIEKLSNAEDGVFTFCALNCTDSIYGCDTIAYNYIKRPFWLMPSATQTISIKYLEGLLSSHNRILQEATKLADKYLDERKKDIYLEPLYVRFIEGEMINGYYRGIWRAEENLIPRITERTEDYRRHITESQWQALCNRHKDLELHKGFLTVEEIAENPIVSIIITGNFTTKELNLVLASIYNQNYPRFEIIINDSELKKADDAYKNKLNLKIIDNGESFNDEALKFAKGRYVMFFDEFAMFTKESLRLMAAKLEADKTLDFVSMLMKQFDGTKYRQIPVLNASYGYGNIYRKKFTKLAKYDSSLCNKLFRKNVLEHQDLWDYIIKDKTLIWKKFVYERMRKGTMITTLSQDDIVKNVGSNPPMIAIKLLNAKNNVISKSVNNLKRHITREDINKIKHKLGL